jgi:predicted CXXCH cytochrome family protein
VAAADQANYAQATGDLSETSHPTTTGLVGGCDHCHDVHSTAASDIPHLLLEDNKDGAYCESCHTTGGGPTIGGSHPYNALVAVPTMNGGLAPPLPWTDEIDDDPSDAVFTGVDYPGATPDWITCESCHSVHRQGVYGPLLRETNATNELCGSCHPANY